MIRRYGGVGGGSSAAEHFASKTSHLIMQALDQPSLAEIQSLCLLIVHEWGCRNAVRAYIYLGQAARMAQMFRVVHTHHTSPDADQFLQDESFRRTLWLIYILDCFLTSSPGRHPALSQLDVQGVPLPCLDMNYHFGSPVYVRTLNGTPPTLMPEGAGTLADVGEFGHIVLATKTWRNVVEMMTTTTLDTFSEQRCLELEQEIEAIRQSLPPHLADKPGQVTLHITMGSGNTYVMIHSLLNCASIFVNRRRILQVVTDETFSLEGWRMSSHANARAVDQIFAASHSIIHSLLMLEHGADKDSILCFPIFMLFSAFTAGSTVAYLALKGLAPPDVLESASTIVSDSLRLCQEGSESWPLVTPWQRHLSVMSKVLREANVGPRDDGRPQHQPSPSIKDDVLSQPDTNPDGMDYEAHPGPVPAPLAASIEDRGSEPPQPRRTGITTINGGVPGPSTSATASPQAGPQPGKADSPDEASLMGGVPPVQPSHEPDMNAQELCNAFERQLLELDDLAAFMGGGV